VLDLERVFVVVAVLFLRGALRVRTGLADAVTTPSAAGIFATAATSTGADRTGATSVCTEAVTSDAGGVATSKLCDSELVGVSTIGASVVATWGIEAAGACENDSTIDV
jgi:hypothetical protein